MSPLTHRDRVVMALNHQEPDRVPIDLMGNASMMLDETYFKLRDYLGLSSIEPFRTGTTANYYDERILDYLDIDFRRIFLKRGPRNKIIEHSDGTFTDAWGIRFEKTGIFVNAIEHPLSSVSTIADVEAFSWPNAQDLFTDEGLGEEARRLYKETEIALVARNPLSLGFLDRSCALIGMSNFMMLLVIAPQVADCIISHLLEIYKGIYGMFLDAVGRYIQMVEVADDLGGQENLLISPEMYRRHIKPVENELYNLIHEKAPDVFIFHHTDGNVFDIIPDLIEIGVNVLNPVQTSARNMDGRRLKEAFGKQLTFHGAIEKMESSKDDLIAEVKEMIDIFGPRGGYVLAPCNHMINVRPENILAMYETAREYIPWRR
jgi:uroporphyrinogen decarboxylase